MAYGTRVRITVFNNKGELIEKLVDDEKEAGTYEVEFPAKGGSGGDASNFSNGIYFYQMKAGNYLFEKEMKIIK